MGRRWVVVATLGCMLMLGASRSAGAAPVDSFFDVFVSDDLSAGVEVSQPAGVQKELLTLTLSVAKPPATMQSGDSGGPGSGTPGLASFFDIFTEIAPDALPADSFFDVFIDVSLPDLGKPKLLPIEPGNVQVTDSFFDVFFDVALPGGAIEMHHLHGELTDPSIASFFDVFAELKKDKKDPKSTGFFDITYRVHVTEAPQPGEPLLRLTLTAQEALPEPGSIVLLSIGAVGMAGCGWRRRKLVG